MKNELRIRNVSETNVKLLKNIARNQGHSTISAFIKVKIREIITAASPRDKQDPDDDSI